MRLFIAFLTIILLVIGLIGVAIGVIAVDVAGETAGAPGVVAALIYSAPPFLIGVVALGASAIVLSIEQATTAQVTAINRGTEVALNEARLAELQRKTPGA